MAKMRMIKSDFFYHEKLSALPPLNRLLFIGLWLLADCNGKLKENVAQIKGCILPYDDINILHALIELQRIKVISRHKINDKIYIQITGWKEHQRPHYLEKTVIFEDLNNDNLINIKDLSVDIKSMSRACDEHVTSISRACHVDMPLTSLLVLDVEDESAGEAEPVFFQSSKNSESSAPLFGSPDGTYLLKKDFKNQKSEGEAQPVLKRVDEVELVFNEYCKSWERNPNTYKLSPERRNWIKKALSLHGIDLCFAAIKNFRNDPWEGRITASDIKYLFGKQDRIDKWCQPVTLAQVDSQKQFASRVKEIIKTQQEGRNK